ncbi:helix-turn-helix domain-containing protein [Paenibacillus tarimensis]
MESEILLCGYSHHTEPFSTDALNGLHGYMFRLQTEGYAWTMLDGNMRLVEPGDLLLLRPGDPYRLSIGPFNHPYLGNVTFSSDYYLSAHGHWLDRWWGKRKRPQIVRIDVEEKLLSLWRMLILEKRRVEQENGELSEYLLRCLCICIDRMIDERSPLRGKPFVASRIKAYIEEHAISSFKIGDVARHVELSESRCSHLFKECYGKTIIEYMQEIRLSVAEERIKYSSLTLEQIAETCGFGSYSYFFRVFRKKYGISPVDYRAQHAPAFNETIKREKRWRQSSLNGHE